MNLQKCISLRNSFFVLKMKNNRGPLFCIKKSEQAILVPETNKASKKGVSDSET